MFITLGDAYSTAWKYEATFLTEYNGAISYDGLFTCVKITGRCRGDAFATSGKLIDTGCKQRTRHS